MKKITVDNVTGGDIELGIVRYFSFGNNKYLIYSLGEKEEQGLIKLYIGKVSSIIENISNDDEWNSIRDLIKKIVTEINNNSLNCIVDLSDSELVDTDLISSRPFRLPIFMAQLLEVKEGNNSISKEQKSIKSDSDNYYSQPINTDNGLETQNVPSEKINGGLEKHFQREKKIDSGNNNNETENQTISTNYQELYLKEKESNSLLIEKVSEYKEALEAVKNIISNIE